MTVVWLVLGILAGTALLVMVTSRVGKPMSDETTSRLQPVLWGLVFVLILGQLLYYYFGR